MLLPKRDIQLGPLKFVTIVLKFNVYFSNKGYSFFDVDSLVSVIL